MDSNNISIGIHYFKVLVQIHYSRSPLGLEAIMGVILDEFQLITDNLP